MTVDVPRISKRDGEKQKIVRNFTTTNVVSQIPSIWYFVRHFETNFHMGAH